MQRTLEESWQAAAAGRLGLEQPAPDRLASTYAIHQAREVADAVFHAAGASAIYASNPLERRMRDILAVSQHLQARQQHFATVGQFLLGLEPDLDRHLSMLTGIDITAITEIAEGAAFGGAGPIAASSEPPEASSIPIGRRTAASSISTGRRATRAAVSSITATFSSCIRPIRPKAMGGSSTRSAIAAGSCFFPISAPGLRAATSGSLHDFGDGLPLRLGFTVVWSGWDATVASGNAALGLSAPAPLEGGRPIIRTIRDEFVAGTRPDSPTEFFRLSYAAAALDQAQARLTRRRRQADPRATVPAAEWEFLDQRRVRLLPAGQRPEPGTLYELTYLARDPVPLGIGLAATRDVVSYLRYDASLGRAARAPARATRWVSASRRPGAICATTSPRASTATRPAAVSSTACWRIPPGSAGCS